MINKFLNVLNENLPRDLMLAYREAAIAAKGSTSNPESDHAELDFSGSERRYVMWDYGKSSYESISKEEALSYLTLDRVNDKWKISSKATFSENLKNLRFLLNGKLMEFEVKPSGSIYYTYWMEIPWEILHRAGFAFKGKSGDTNDSKFANKGSDIANIISICDKIYKTDEYEHPITAADVYKRKEKSKINVIKSMLSKNDPAFDPHNMYANFGKASSDIIANDGTLISAAKDNTRKFYNEPDTGAHNPRNSATYIGNLGRAELSYAQSYERKRALYNKYDIIRHYIKKLIRERDTYDDLSVYESELSKWKDKEKIIYADYIKVSKETSERKSDLLRNVSSEMVANSKKRESYLKEVQQIKDKLYATFNSYKDFKKRLSAPSAEVRLRFSNINSDLIEIEKQISDTQENIENINDDSSLAVDDLSNDEIQAKIREVLDTRAELEEISFKEYLTEVRRLENEMKELQNREDELRPTTARLRKEKEEREKERDKKTQLDPSLENIVQFVDESTETAETAEVTN